MKYIKMNENIRTPHQTRNLTYTQYNQALIIKQKDLEMARKDFGESHEVDEF